MVKSGVVKTNGFEMDYCSFGNGDKISVLIPGLCIQSVMGAQDAVEAGCAVLNDDFTTYLIDRRREIPDDYSIYDMADDTAAAMKELGLSNTYLFGASQGGMIAMVIAIRYPELVKKLALGSTSSHIHPEQRKVIDKWISLAIAKDRQGLYHEYGKEIYPANVYEQYKDYFTEVAQTVTDEEMERFVILARSILDFNVTDELKKIKCPVIALGEFNDEVLDSDATMEIAEQLDERPDFVLYMYSGYGHAVFDTAPDYKKRLYDFYMKE